MKKIIPVILCQLGILFLYTCPVTAAGRPMLTGIQFESPSNSEDRVICTLNGSTLPRIFEIKGKRPRLVMDLPDTGQALWLKNTIKINGHFVHRIRIGMHKGKNPGTRVVLDLAPSRPIHFDHHFNRKNNILIINLYPAAGATKPAATISAQAKTPPAKKPGTIISLQPAGRKAVPLAAPQPAARQIIAPAPAKKHLVRKKQSRPKKAVAAVTAATPHPAGTAPAGRPAAAPQANKERTAIPAPSITAPRQLPEKPAPPAITEKPAATEAAEPAVPWSVAPAVPAAKTAREIPPLTPVPGREKQTAIKPLPPAGQLQKKKPAPTSNTAPVIKSIKFDNRSSRGETISFQLNGFYPPQVMGLQNNPPRVGCDFKNATVRKSVKKLIKCNGKYVKTIQVEPSHNPDRVKVVLNLVPGSKYDLQQIFFKQDNLFVIIINRVDKKVTLM